MRKILLVYPSFILACLVVIWVFITATTYVQLSVAVLLYPLLTFFVYKVFKGDSWRIGRNHPKKHAAVIKPRVITEKKIAEAKEKNIVVADIDKRAFLKIVGASGAFFFLLSIFGRRAESLFLGQGFVQQNRDSIGNLPVNEPNTAKASPTEGYNISEIDDDLISYYGFINKQGGWFIMKGDTNTGSFRYTKGGSDLPNNWKNRKNLKYDYLDKVFL